MDDDPFSYTDPRGRCLTFGMNDGVIIDDGSAPDEGIRVNGYPVADPDLVGEHGKGMDGAVGADDTSLPTARPVADTGRAIGFYIKKFEHPGKGKLRVFDTDERDIGFGRVQGRRGPQQPGTAPGPSDMSPVMKVICPSPASCDTRSAA